MGETTPDRSRSRQRQAESPAPSRARAALAVLGAVLGLSILGYALFSGETDEEKVRRLLDRLEDAVAITAEHENPLARAGRINGEFGEIFTKEVVVTLPEFARSTRGRRELGQLATRSIGVFRTLDVDFGDLQMTLGNVGGHVDSTLDIRGSQGGGPRVERRRARLELEQLDGEWRISRIQLFPLESESALESESED